MTGGFEELIESAQYHQLLPGAPPPLNPPARPYRAAVVVEAAVTDEFRNAIAEWLVKTGCLYMVAWGDQCSEWDDAVDWVNLEDTNFEEIPDDRFVMTTWHAQESLAESIWFAKHVALHPHVLLVW